MDGGAHEGEAFVAHTIATCVLNLTDQAVGAQEVQQTPYAAAVAALLLRIMGFWQPEMARNVAGVKAALDVFPPQDRQEQLLVLMAERVECATTTTLKRDRVAGAVDDLRTNPGVLDHSQRSEVAMRGLTRDLGIAAEEGDALRQREPVADALALAVAPATD